MPSINLNQMLAQMPKKASGDTGTLEIPAGKIIKTEISPLGDEIVIGTVPVNKKWHIRFIVHIEELDA